MHSHLSTLLGSDGDGAGRYMLCYIITVKHCATLQLSVMIPANKKQGGENGRIVTVAKPALLRSRSPFISYDGNGHHNDGDGDDDYR